jgi:hypothetical protein
MEKYELLKAYKKLTKSKGFLVLYYGQNLITIIRCYTHIYDSSIKFNYVIYWPCFSFV